jgi:hypothetical protein
VNRLQVITGEEAAAYQGQLLHQANWIVVSWFEYEPANKPDKPSEPFHSQ